MAKPNKTSEEFLLKRRKAIADKAKELIEQKRASGSGVSLGKDSNKSAAPISLRSATASNQH